MKNLRHTRRSNIVLALAVPAGTVAGDVISIGPAEGLTALALTDEATSTTIDEGKAAPGLEAGEASVELPGIGTAVDLTINAVGAAALGAKIYLTAGGEYTIEAVTSTVNNTRIGYALEAIAASGTGLVGLVRA
jgi:hypothetical protein